jgi:hypothetical protein
MSELENSASAEPPVEGYGQIIIQTMVGQMVIGADGLHESALSIVNELLGESTTPTTPDALSGRILQHIAANPAFAPSLSVGQTQSHLSNLTVWLRYVHEGTWWTAVGHHPDRLEWMQHS